MTGLLRAARIPELEGDRLRLHVERKVFGGRVGAERGKCWLNLSPSDDLAAHDEEAMVVLPIEQFDALAEACAAFNSIMDEHECRATLSQLETVHVRFRPDSRAVRTPEINPR